MSNPYAGLTVELSKREKEIIYFALSRLLDATKTDEGSKEWDKIDRLRDRFKQED